MNNVKLAKSLYKKLLQKYLQSSNKACLVEAEEMSQYLIENNIYPEEIIHIHLKTIEKIYPNIINDEQRYAFEFLHESLSSYRKAYENLHDIQIEQDELKAEIQIAAAMQKTLMTTDIPKIDGIDIGAISVPYHQMNGDYYRFIRREDGVLGVAIADIIGKGVPAALSMSMIKYAMDSFYIEDLNAQYILQNLNRVVSKNIASHMFITMFYGQYYPETCTFKYVSVGQDRNSVV